MRTLTTEQWLACVGAGWHGIVRPLIKYAQDHDLEISQVKEKFGGLRFYCATDETLNAMIEKAEAECWKTCETCGLPGELRRGTYGWMKTACEQHK